MLLKQASEGSRRRRCDLFLTYVTVIHMSHQGHYHRNDNACRGLESPCTNCSSGCKAAAGWGLPHKSTRAM